MTNKVLFDCTALANWTGHATGIQRVVSEIGRELVHALPGTILGLFDSNDHCRAYSIERRAAEDVIDLSSGDLVVTAGSNWDYPEHHARLLALCGRGVRLATLFHDTIPVILPFSYGPGFSDIYRNWLTSALQHSFIAFSNSENTKRDIQAFAASSGLVCPPVYPLRLGDDVPSASEGPSEAIRTKIERPFILSVGTLEYRKNHITLLNAYRYLIERKGVRPPPLYIVGKKGWLDHDIEYQVANDPRLRELVFILQGISDSDLYHLYQRCLFTVYPSFYEGWGLPVAESMCLGKPCIASGTSSMLEIAPGLTRHADPLLTQDWAQQIESLSEDRSLLEQESRRIRDGYRPHAWSDTAVQLAAALAKHLSAPGQTQ